MVMPSDPTSYPAIVGNSAAMVRLKCYLPKVARTDSVVLVTGESGTGKELVSREIHNLSGRCRHPIVFVNCAALPDGLLESELFGYERGAFTGAVTRSSGLLTHADGGTVVLDEIGDMSLPAQAKLLRVLETREVHRLGARGPEPLDIRFIAATNQRLEDLVQEHRFRGDLFYRLDVLHVELPPLRDRREDIPALAQDILERLCAARGIKPPALGPETLATLVQYSWPGNVRELRNVLEALCVDTTDQVMPEHLPHRFQKLIQDNGVEKLDERERLLAALLSTNWNKTRAAEQLHWSRMTLYRKLHKYAIKAMET
jgi:transcriptional regulator with PAS, ATPase and Fis domain